MPTIKPPQPLPGLVASTPGLIANPSPVGGSGPSSGAYQSRGPNPNAVIPGTNFTIIDRATRKAVILVFGDGGCLAGDTHVAFQIRTSDGSRIQNSKGGTIELLYHRFHRIPRKGKGNYQRTQTMDASFYIASVNEDGMILTNRIENVIDSGEKDVYLVRTDTGREIKATLDHKFLTDDGYIPLSELSSGSVVCVESRVARATGRSPRHTRAEVYVKNHKSAPTKIVAGKYTYKRLTVSRAVIESIQNGMSYDEYIGTLDTASPEEVERLWAIPEGFEVHHLDENPKNDAPENLVLVEQAEHQILYHREESKKRLARYTTTETIVSIEFAGRERTFDIVCGDPYRNFLAEGFVVHNCGKSTFGLVHTPQPAVLIGFDGRSEFIEEQQKLAGKPIPAVQIPPPSVLQKSDNVKAAAQEALKEFFLNYDGAIEASKTGKVRTIVIDTASELGEIITLSVRGTLENPKGDYGRSKDQINQIWWKVFGAARFTGNAHVIVLARASSIWEGNEPTGDFKARVSDTVRDAVDFSLHIRLGMGAPIAGMGMAAATVPGMVPGLVGGLVSPVGFAGGGVSTGMKPKEFELVVKKSGNKNPLEKLNEVYRQSDWGEAGPFAYACSQLMPGTTVEDWR